jgi:predicted deacylase
MSEQQVDDTLGTAVAHERPEPSWWPRRRAGEIVPCELLAEEGWVVRAYVATGARPGPVLTILAGIHGDEYEGPLAIAELLATLPLGELAGTVLAVPVSNPPAFAAGTRENPLDGKNLARCFPGSSVGTVTERLAWALTNEAIVPADAMIDLHSAGVAYEMPLLVGYCVGPGAVGARSRDLALAFGAPLVWEHPEIAPGRTLSAALDRGIPCVYTEASGGGGAPPETIRCYVEGLRRALISLAMLPGAPPAPRHDAFWRGAGDTDRTLAAPATGLLRGAVAVGDPVAVGQTLGEIVDYDGRLLATIAAPVDGVVVMTRRLPRVAAGDGLYLLTTPVAE